MHFPEEELECPDSPGCTVQVQTLMKLAAAKELRFVRVPSKRSWYRVYDASDGYGLPNPGFGDTRFAPFDEEGTGLRVPVMYLAESLSAALLETSLHDVHLTMPRVVPEITLLGKLHARVLPPQELKLVDLRDAELIVLGLPREAIVSSSAEHYPCTRRIAKALHAELAECDGLLWNSRQAELTGQVPTEVAIVFCDRVAAARSDWALAQHRSASGALLEGTGRLILEELAEELGVTLLRDDSLES